MWSCRRHCAPAGRRPVPFSLSRKHRIEYGLSRNRCEFLEPQAYNVWFITNSLAEGALGTANLPFDAAGYVVGEEAVDAFLYNLMAMPEFLSPAEAALVRYRYLRSLRATTSVEKAAPRARYMAPTIQEVGGGLKPMNAHIFSDTHKTFYTAAYNKILNKYGLSTKGAWNQFYMPHGAGRHPDAYLEYMLEELRKVDILANLVVLNGFIHDIREDFLKLPPHLLCQILHLRLGCWGSPEVDDVTPFA